MRPSAIRSLVLRTARFQVMGQFTISSTPADRTARAMRSAPGRSAAMGFSVTMWMPWAAMASATSGWRAFSGQKITTSIFSRASMSR